MIVNPRLFFPASLDHWQMEYHFTLWNIFVNENVSKFKEKC